MKRITPNRAVLFIVVMTAVAFVVYLPHYRREQQRTQAAVQEQRMAENEAQRAEYMTRYVDVTSVKKPGIQTVALAVASADGKPDRAVEGALARRFQSSTVQILPSFFKPSFISDGLFTSALNGTDDIPQRLELTKSLDELLLARETVEYSTNGPDLENVLTATMRLDITAIPVDGNAAVQTWSFTAAGSGFSQTAAQAMAEERLVKQITEDRKMSL